MMWLSADWTIQKSAISQNPLFLCRSFSPVRSSLTLRVYLSQAPQHCTVCVSTLFGIDLKLRCHLVFVESKVLISRLNEVVDGRLLLDTSKGPKRRTQSWGQFREITSISERTRKIRDQISPNSTSKSNYLHHHQQFLSFIAVSFSLFL